MIVVSNVSLGLIISSFIVLFTRPIFFMIPLDTQLLVGVDIITQGLSERFHQASSFDNFFPVIFSVVSGFFVILLTKVQKVKLFFIHILLLIIQIFFGLYIYYFFLSLSKYYFQSIILMFLNLNIFLAITLLIFYVINSLFYVVGYMGFMYLTWKND
jgi:hypothetical protein